MTAQRCTMGAAAASRVVTALLLASLPFAGGLVLRFAPHSSVDARWQYLAYDVGLEPGSTVSLDLQCAGRANNTYVMMITHTQLLRWHQAEPDTLVSLTNPGAGLNSYLTSTWRTVFIDGAKATFNISAPSRDRYHVGILNAQGQDILLSGSLTMVNPGGQQLRVQDIGLPTVVLFSAALFGLTCTCITFCLLNIWRRHASVMHFGMALVVFLKGLELFLRWCGILQVSRTGSESLVISVCWQLIAIVQSILELMMFLLVALGWKFLRSTLNPTEARFAGGIAATSFYLGIFEMFCTQASTCSGYKLSRYILHSLCSLVVIVAMNFNLQMIHAQLLEAPASAEAGRLYGKLQAYKAFRWVFLAFIVAPTVELFLKVSVTPWDAKWISVLVEQLRTWVIYGCVCYYFRPDPKPMRVFELTRDVHDDDDEDEVAEVGE